MIRTPSAVSLPDAYILAGGRCRRFGADKARAELNGSPLIVRLKQALQNAGVRQVSAIAADTTAYTDLGLRTLADFHPGLGPLAGLERALTDAWERGADWALLLSCDLVVLQPDWLRRLLRHRQANTQAVCFRNEHWQPFPGLYRTSLLPLIRERLASGETAFKQLLNDPAAVAVAADFPDDWPRFVSVNTPAELRWHSFLQRCERRKQAEANGSPP